MATQSIRAMLRDYAAWLKYECGGEDDALEHIHLAGTRAETEIEALHIARAMLARHDALTDAPYRVGGPRVDPQITAIAQAARYYP